MRKLMGVAVLALAAAAAGPARAQVTLNVGDPAPKLEVKEFVKGQPVTAFARGKNYVVEFWATWCGPCRTSIPHLTELQKKYPEIAFIGVSVWESDPSKVKPFVAEMGDKMAYRVAMDLVPEGARGNDGKMAKSWMTAAGENGIPSAFIVNGEGKIAWIGHPMTMDQPLAKIAKGEWDMQAAIAQRKREKAQQEQLQALSGKLRQAQAQGPKAQLAVLDEALAADPTLIERVGFFKLNLMLTSGAEGVGPFAGKLAEAFKDNPQGLNQLAWMIVDPKRPKAPADAAKAALAAAQRADQLRDGKDAAIADTLARAYFVTGDAARAVEAQERAIKLAAGTELEKDATLKERLAEYKKAATP